MAIDLEIAVPEKLVTKKFELPESVVSSFELYVQAAQAEIDNVSESAVLQALIERQLRKDRKFKEWVAQQRQAGKAQKDTAEP